MLYLLGVTFRQCLPPPRRPGAPAPIIDYTTGKTSFSIDFSLGDSEPNKDAFLKHAIELSIENTKAMFPTYSPWSRWLTIHDIQDSALCPQTLMALGKIVSGSILYSLAHMTYLELQAAYPRHEAKRKRQWHELTQRWYQRRLAVGLFCY